MMEFYSMSGGLRWGDEQCPAAIVAGGDRDGMIYAIQGGFQNLVLVATLCMSLALKRTT